MFPLARSVQILLNLCLALNITGVGLNSYLKGSYKVENMMRYGGIMIVAIPNTGKFKLQEVAPPFMCRCVGKIIQDN